MSAWETVKLGDVASIDRRGVDPRVLPGDTYYLGLEHIARGGEIVGSSTVEQAELASTKFRFDRNHVLFGKLRPNLGKVARPEKSGICSTDILPIRPGPKLDRSYLVHYLRQPAVVDNAAAHASGANLPRLSPSALSWFGLPLPPVDEQRRIAAILDEADAIRAKRRSQLAHLDELPKALFHEMFKDDRDVAPLGSAAQFSGGGSLPESISFEDQAEGTLLMRVSDMNAPGNEKYIRNTARWTSRATVRSTTVDGASVIIPKRGAAIATNKKRISTRRTALDPNLMGITPDPAELDVEYLYAWFCSFDLSRMVSGSSVPQLNKKDLAPLEIPLPPLQAQQVFAQETTAIRAERDRVARALEADDELFSALQHRAFRGEL